MLSRACFGRGREDGDGDGKMRSSANAKWPGLAWPGPARPTTTTALTKRPSLVSVPFAALALVFPHPPACVGCVSPANPRDARSRPFFPFPLSTLFTTLPPHARLLLRGGDREGAYPPRRRRAAGPRTPPNSCLVPTSTLNSLWRTCCELQGSQATPPPSPPPTPGGPNALSLPYEHGRRLLYATLYTVQHHTTSTDYD